MTEAVLEVSNLSKSFGGVDAVRDVTFSLAPGELLALIGPNGAGKTTCFNMISGQLAPNRGSIAFRGGDGERRELVGLRPREIWRLGVGRTFQITATYPSMTVAENVQMALISHHRRIFNPMRLARALYRDRALELLETVGMAEQADRAASILAYGDLKRMELAIALANEPRLLLMDEPTAGMAPQERIELMKLTAGIVRERGVSVLFTEHDVDVVFAHSHRVMVLARGQLIAQGTAEEVRADPHVQEVYLGGGTTFGHGAGEAEHV